jgi:hypothetical protein
MKGRQRPYSSLVPGSRIPTQANTESKPRQDEREKEEKEEREQEQKQKEKQELDLIRTFETIPQLGSAQRSAEVSIPRTQSRSAALQLARRALDSFSSVHFASTHFAPTMGPVSSAATGSAGDESDAHFRVTTATRTSERIRGLGGSQ